MDTKKNMSPYAILSLDIDWFKSVNDKFGHDVGDAVLIKFAQILKSSVRDADKVYRTGGEEFIILLSRISYKRAYEIAQTISNTLRSNVFEFSGETFSKTVSCAIFHSSLFNDTSMRSIMKNLDSALYQSKTNGRDRITPVSEMTIADADHPRVVNIEIVASDNQCTNIESIIENNEHKQHLDFTVHEEDKCLFHNVTKQHTQDAPYITTVRIKKNDKKIRIYQAVSFYKNEKFIVQLTESSSLTKTVIDKTLIQNLHSMLENTDDYIYFKDRLHHFTAASKSLVNLTTLNERSELVGKSDYDVFSQEFADEYFLLERQIFDGNLQVAQKLQPTLDKDGNKGWVDNRKYPVKNELGKVIGLFGVARVISDEEFQQKSSKTL